MPALRVIAERAIAKGPSSVRRNANQKCRCGRGDERAVLRSRVAVKASVCVEREMCGGSRTSGCVRACVAAGENGTQTTEAEATPRTGILTGPGSTTREASSATSTSGRKGYILGPMAFWAIRLGPSSTDSLYYLLEQTGSSF